MNDRYKIINECDHSNIWYKDFPAQLEKTRVLFDSATDKIVIQFKLRNISNKTIDTTYLKIVCCDISGQEIAVIDKHIMPMLDVVPNNNFGDKNPLFAEDKRIASVSVYITKAVFADGTTWDNSALNTGIEIQPAASISFTGELHEQFLRSSTNIPDKVVMFEDHNDYWRCTCGRVNISTTDCCGGCKVKKTDLQNCFSVDYLKAKLDEYKEQQEIVRRDTVYSNSLALSKNNDLSDIEKAKIGFLSITEWKDAADKVAYCEQRIAELKDAQEKQRVVAEKNVKIISAIVAAVVVVGSAVAVLCVNVIIPNSKYNNAMSLLASGKYDEAYVAFEELGDYSNASVQLSEVRYQQAVDLLNNGLFDDAFSIFYSIKEYSDSVEKIKECTYNKALQFLNNGEYENAIQLFVSLGSYKNSADKIVEIKNSLYDKACQLFETGCYEEAYAQFDSLSDYKDSLLKKAEAYEYFKTGTFTETSKITVGNSLLFELIYLEDRHFTHEVTATISKDYKNGTPDLSNVTVKWDGGFTYVGEFYNNEITGSGKLYAGSKLIYEGDFKNGQFSGNGTLYWINHPSSKLIIGTWEKGNICGNYTRYYSDGSLNDKGYVENGIIYSDKYGTR